ncbi:MAG: hypothetical protein GF313_10350 [Caldithrix sp.]|nr:hypothetical protein [Caldithrix sp.]
MKMYLMAGLTGLFLICGACQISSVSVPQAQSLNGSWRVHHIRWDNVIIDTTYLDLRQHNSHVIFLEGRDTLSTGTLVKDTIYCTDMYNAGISRIFVDNARHMHSELPALEYLRMLEFFRE